MAEKDRETFDQDLVCTSCNDNSEVLSFCSDCDIYMCERCHSGHKQMRFLFAKHHVTLIHDLDTVSHHQDDRCACAVHQHNKDLFCETCTIHVCPKCVVINHRDHVIQNQEDFEKDIGQKIDDISLKCNQEKGHLKKNIQHIEQVRQDVHEIFKDLEDVITKEHEKKIGYLVETQATLVENVRSLEIGFDEELDKLRAIQGKRAKMMRNWLSSVMMDRLNNLVWRMVYGDLEKLLIETNDTTRVDRTKQAAKSIQFCSADERLLDHGHLQAGMHIVREFKVPADIWGMAALSVDTVVAVSGGKGKGSYSFSLSGEEQSHLASSKGSVHDLTFLTDGKPVVSRSCSTCCVCPNDDTCFEYTCKQGEWDLRLCSDQSDNVYAVNKNPEIYIFQGSNSNPQRVIPIGNKPIQISVTKTGVMIPSTGSETPSTVHVYDIEGHLGSTLTSVDDSEYLYTAVDSYDRVLVARVNRGSHILRLIRYRLKGLQLIQQITFRDLKLPHKIDQPPYFCYMVLVTPLMLAFASLGKRLYFIELDA